MGIYSLAERLLASLEGLDCMELKYFHIRIEESRNLKPLSNAHIISIQ
jgi:hypothetical protein